MPDGPRAANMGGSRYFFPRLHVEKFFNLCSVVLYLLSGPLDNSILSSVSILYFRVRFLVSSFMTFRQQ